MRTFLLDGTALAYRAHFAFTARGDGLTTASGHPTSATYGFTLTLRALLEREEPERIAVAFDGPRGALERTAIYPEYKATRAKAPDELVMQLGDVREVVEAYGIPIIELEGQEADDVIGTLALRCMEAGDDVFIVTGDKDFMQLVGDGHVKLYDIMQRGSNEPKIIGPAEVEAKFAVGPASIIDLLALMGDSSDNVPGVKGVGPKTAAKLLQEHGSLDAVLDAAPAMKKSKLRENLIECRDLALLSRDLVRIRTDLDLDLGPADLHAAKPDAVRLLALYERLEFRNLVGEVRKRAEARAQDDVVVDYRVVESLEECKAVARRLFGRDRFAIDAIVEHDGSEPDLVGLTVATRPGRAFYVPVANTDPEWLACLREPLEQMTGLVVGHDLKTTLKALWRNGLRLGGRLFDTTVASYCIAPGVRRHDLASQADQLLGHSPAARRELTGSGKKAVPLRQLTVQTTGPWAAEIADSALRLHDPLATELEAFDVGRLFREIEMPLLPVLADIEERGVRIDLDYMAELHTKMAARIEELSREIWNEAGEEFNIASNQQLGTILFEKLEIHKRTKTRAPRKTSTGQWATDAAVLERISGHPLGRLLLEWRRLTKLEGTYVDALPKLVRPSTGRIHTSFNQAVAATGRLSSEDPNLQNIPIRTEDGRQLRRAFVAGEKGWKLISADYSQIELRILAHASGDENLCAGFIEGQDVHARTASIVFGVMPALVDTRMRSQAKVINYGLVYGMGVQRLANETGMSQTEARKFIDAYFKAMPRVKDWLDTTLQHGKETGEVRTIFGRRRPLADIGSNVARIRANAENVAVNSPIQGSAADIIKRAMIDLHAALREAGLRGRMLLQVHDELVLECPPDEVEAVSDLVRRCMSGAAELSVPLDVDIGVGASWLDAHG